MNILVLAFSYLRVHFSSVLLYFIQDIVVFNSILFRTSSFQEKAIAELEEAGYLNLRRHFVRLFKKSQDSENNGSTKTTTVAKTDQANYSSKM